MEISVHSVIPVLRIFNIAKADEFYLGFLGFKRKLALVKECNDIPKPIEEIIVLTNMIRNAIAHSFFPMNKRDFKRTGKVTYKGKDIFTLEGLKRFNDDTNKGVGCLSDLAFGAPDLP